MKTAMCDNDFVFQISCLLDCEINKTTGNGVVRGYEGRRAALP